jgi:hypothetical protein
VLEGSEARGLKVKGFFISETLSQKISLMLLWQGISLELIFLLK